MAIKEDYTEKYCWWISELNSLGINTEAKDEELRDIQALEDLGSHVHVSSITIFGTVYNSSNIQ